MPETAQERVSAEELLRLPLFEGEEREAVEWIASKFEVRSYATGDVLASEGDAANEFVVILDGEVHFRRGTQGEVFVGLKGQATGVLPFSRMKTWGGRGWAVQPTRIGVMDAALLGELVYRAPTLAQRLVAEMTDRTRRFTRMEEGSNRLLALGKLAAGLAHELNNPASAAVRSSARLRDVLARRRTCAQALSRETLSDQAAEMLARLADSIAECTATPGAMDAMERADREAELSDWLESVGAPDELASGFVDAGIDAGQLRPFSALVSRNALSAGLRILALDHEALCLTRELEEASRRISDLVQAVKSYSYMDQNAVAEVDIEEGIDATLRMFQHQLKHGVQVSRQFAGHLPRVHANGSALNQIWTNLIDNALDAMNELPPDAPRKLLVRTCTEPNGVLIEVCDSGPGIPVGLQSRIFEPFFTTKEVGDGTGLGLDIVQRIVRSHKGSISVDSAPGRTVFQVRLPLESA